MKKITSIMLALMMIFALVACGSNTTKEGSSTPSESSVADTPESTESSAGLPAVSEETDAEIKALVAYFSWSSSHNTQTMAEYVADAAGGELFRIEPKTPYTTDYNAVIDVAQEEQNNNARPALAQTLTQEQLDEYDVIFIGYPVWWYDAPMVIYSFMEPLDFSDKTVVTFATSGGSGISDSSLQNAVTANYLDGLCIPNFSAGSSTQSQVQDWVRELGFAK